MTCRHAVEGNSDSQRSSSLSESAIVFLSFSYPNVQLMIAWLICTLSLQPYVTDGCNFALFLFLNMCFIVFM